MNSFMEDTTRPRKISRYHLTMAALVVTVIAVGITTIVGSTSSLATKAPSKAVQRVSVSQTETNPPIIINCERPVLTIALVLDRSGSVSGDRNNPGLYKQSVNRFLDNLSGVILSSNGEMNVLLYAFGSRTINQNKTTASNELITTINSNTTLADMKDAVNRIFFSVDARGNNPASMNGSSLPYDIRRGYNAGVPTPNATQFTLTNWDDALREIGQIGSSSYADSTPGKHIALTLMLTDGQPNVNNGSNRTFEPGDAAAYNEAAGRDYATQTVSSLRRGTATRPPMAVRGVLINSTASSAMNQVFGSGSDNWSQASNFEEDLQKILDNIVDQIQNGEPCQSIYVKPAINVEVNPRNVEVTEGSSRNVTVTITNNSTATKKDGTPLVCPPTACDLNDVQISVLGTVIGTLDDLAPGETRTVTFSVQIPLGGIYSPGPDAVPTVRAIGSFVVSSKVKLDPSVTLSKNPDGSYKVPDSTTYSVSIDRLALPA